MAAYTNDNLGVTGNGFTYCYAMSGVVAYIFMNVQFPIDLKPTYMEMQVAPAYGDSETGDFVSTTGGFYGRYCIWNSNGGILAQSDIVRCTTGSGYNPYKAFVRANFSNPPEFKAGVTYRIGFVRANNGNKYASSWVSYKYNVNKAHCMNYIYYSSISDAQINSGNISIPASGYNQIWNVYPGPVPCNIAPRFNLGYEEVFSGGRKWDGSQWQKLGILQWNGSQWTDIPLKKWNGSSWEDVR